MPIPSYSQLTTLSTNSNGLQPESIEERILTVLSILASGLLRILSNRRWAAFHRSL